MEQVVNPFVGKEFYLLYFLILKKGGGLALILDLPLLNTSINKTKFHMVMLALIFPSLFQGVWFTALNMKYQHLPSPLQISLFHVGANH